MKHRVLALPIALAGLVGGFGDSTGDAVTFHPEIGIQLAKRFVTQGRLAWPASTGKTGAISFRYELACVDEFRALAAGKPLELLRTLETVQVRGEDVDLAGYLVGRKILEVKPWEYDGSQLEGKRLRFLWSDEEQDDARSWVGDEGNELVRSAMNVDLDLRALLPEREVERGDSWKVDGGFIWEALLPGLDLERITRSSDPAQIPHVTSDLIESLRRLLANTEATCTWRGTWVVDGRDLGEIELAGSVRQGVSLDGVIFLSGDQYQTSALSMDLDLALGGTCQWDMQEGRFASLDLRLNGSVTVHGDAYALDLTQESRAEPRPALVSPAAR